MQSHKLESQESSNPPQSTENKQEQKVSTILSIQAIGQGQAHIPTPERNPGEPESTRESKIELDAEKKKEKKPDAKNNNEEKSNEIDPIEEEMFTQSQLMELSEQKYNEEEPLNPQFANFPLPDIKTEDLDFGPPVLRREPLQHEELDPLDLAPPVLQRQIGVNHYHDPFSYDLKEEEPADVMRRIIIVLERDDQNRADWEEYVRNLNPSEMKGMNTKGMHTISQQIKEKLIESVTLSPDIIGLVILMRHNELLTDANLQKVIDAKKSAKTIFTQLRALNEAVMDQYGTRPAGTDITQQQFDTIIKPYLFNRIDQAYVAGAVAGLFPSLPLELGRHIGLFLKDPKIAQVSRATREQANSNKEHELENELKEIDEELRKIDEELRKIGEEQAKKMKK